MMLAALTFVLVFAFPAWGRQPLARVPRVLRAPQREPAPRRVRQGERRAPRQARALQAPPLVRPPQGTLPRRATAELNRMLPSATKARRRSRLTCLHKTPTSLTGTPSGCASRPPALAPREQRVPLPTPRVRQQGRPPDPAPVQRTLLQMRPTQAIAPRLGTM